jgi:DNA-directed RNA polymerase subunit M/transcription elongation factor TFIIS
MTSTSTAIEELLFKTLKIKSDTEELEDPIETLQAKFASIKESCSQSADGGAEAEETFFRKVLFWIDRLTESTDIPAINTTCVSKHDWDTQLTHIPWFPELLTFIVDFYTRHIPEHIWNHDIVQRVIIPRYEKTFNREQAELIVRSILVYAFVIAQECDVPIHFNDPLFRVIIKTKHSMIISSILNEESGDNLKEHIDNGEVPSVKLAFMSRKQLLPKYYEEKVKTMLQRTEMEDTGILDPKNMEDGFYECMKCHKFKTRHYSMQIRSADEPMTTFIRCYLCHYTWKE